MARKKTTASCRAGKEAFAWRDGRFANAEQRRQWQQEHWPEGPRT